MREILFRGKSLDDGRWIEGDLSRTCGRVYIFQEDAFDSVDRYEVDPETVGQYTGENDRNGNRIFEGDILKMYNRNGKPVVFDEVLFACGCFRMAKPAMAYEFTYSNHELEEVAGNIHDNPELLERKLD